MLSVNEINLLKSQNEALKKQNTSLQKELRRKHEQLEAVSKELDDYIQNLSKSDFEKMLQENNKKRLIEELSDLTDDLMLKTITTRDGETYDIYTCSELTYNLINKTMNILMEDL